MKLFTFKNKRHMPTWLAWLLAVFVKAVSLTYCVTIEDKGGWLEKQRPWPVVVSIWHNRILFLAAIAPKSLLQRMTVLISSSRDGEYVASFIRFFGLSVARGSSSKGGVRALLALDNELASGRSVILTLDGPRGPIYTVHPGPILLAGKNKAAILPVSVNASHCWKLKSWDRMQIPCPFSKVSLVVGKPFSVPLDFSREQGMDFIKRELMYITID